MMMFVSVSLRASVMSFISHFKLFLQPPDGGHLRVIAGTEAAVGNAAEAVSHCGETKCANRLISNTIEELG